MSVGLQGLITKLIGGIFDNAKSKLIGPSTSRGIVFGYKNFNPKETIEWIYRNVLTDHLATLQPDPDSINLLQDRVEHFLDKAKGNYISDVQAVFAAHDHAKLLSEKADTKDPDLINLRQQLSTIKEKAIKHVGVIAESELAMAQNIGALDGILGLSNAMGVSDPTVFKLGVLDRLRCKHCWALWTLEDKITPRLYKLSELKAEAGKPPYEASVGLTHPNCRDVLTILAPGFGFDNGNITYKEKGHDELFMQRE